MEHGFLPVNQITHDMHLLREDGRIGMVTGWKVVPGTKTMYNLEVACVVHMVINHAISYTLMGLLT